MTNFIKFKKIYFLISAFFLVPGILSLIFWGLKPAIDFTGGTLLELRLQQNDQCQMTNVKDTLGEEGVGVVSTQVAGGTCLLRLHPVDEAEKNEILTTLSDKLGAVEEVRFETVGPTLGRELLDKTMVSVVLAAGFILAYVAYQFKDKMYGICAILAMFHDTLILLGSFSLLGHFLGVEVDVLFVTAVLTTLSFSVHDTVVVYNGIRDAARSHPKASFENIVNQAIGETLVRSLNNSLTIIFMLLALVLLGGPTIRWFVVALLIGTVAGTYSSTFTAAPLLIVWKRIRSERS
ncbi:protein translocase subunit SecF [Candidatus Parcubacteria bacterium]|nr:protein translocase subunit SecF [Candidatus Parcubacteria bacterium]